MAAGYHVSKLEAYCRSVSVLNVGYGLQILVVENKMETESITTFRAWCKFLVEALVTVELWPLKLFHVETSEVAVVLERAYIMQAWPFRAADGNVQHEVSLTRSLDYHAQLHIHLTVKCLKTRGLMCPQKLHVVES